MKKVVLIFFFYYNFINLHPQKYNQFEFTSDSGFFCSVYINLYPSNKFTIDFNYYLSDDIGVYGVFNIGKYYINGDSYIFIDELTKNKFIIKKEKDKYICKKIYEFMNGKEIILDEGNLEDYNRVKLAYGDINSRKRLLTNILNNANETKSNFKPGLYLGQHSLKNRDFYFIFNQNGTFLFMFDKKILLKGDWEVTGNLLLLKDKYLENPFYMQIKGTEELVCIAIPGQNDFQVFKLYSHK